MAVPPNSASRDPSAPAGLVPPVGAGRHILVVLIIACIGVGGWWYTRERAGKEKEEAAKEKPAPIVALADAATLFPDLMREATDGADFSETVAYLRALRELKQFSVADFAARPKAEIDYAQALADPAAYRGKLVHRRGIIAWRRAEKLKDPEQAGISDVYRGVLTDTDASDGIAFDLPEPPPDIESHRDLVEVEGVFYRTVTFENDAGKKITVPYLLCRTLKIVDPSTLKKSFDSTPNAFGIAIIAMGLMWFLYRVFTLKTRPVVTGIRLRDRAALARVRPMSPTPPAPASGPTSSNNPLPGSSGPSGPTAGPST